MMYLLCEWKVPKGSDVCFYVSEMFDIGSTLHTTQQISEAALERSEHLLLLVTQKVLGAVQGVGECSRCLAAEWGEVCLLHEVVEDGLYGGRSVVMVLVVPMSRVSRPARSPTAASAHQTHSHCHGETQRDSKSQETRVSGWGSWCKVDLTGRATPPVPGGRGRNIPVELWVEIWPGDFIKSSH